ncbi:type 1 glutamine amidotransferase [Frigidibacter sp. SD6-1]|uniref:type 1 glutamine amidotransferase n=1 Tax=Frigidibacter sp. SD6-1 TaxID=3032581 RepID=UPI0024DF4A47|nr:type 1 glutamine amidotransferase [Frigidibacter sp. SD6-1]
MRVAVIENTEVSHLGQVGVALREADAEIQTYRAWAGQALPDGSYHDALVVLGGEQNARADKTHPYLPDLVRLMRRMGQADKAVLGICLGCQLLARAWGGRNLLGIAPEFGWHQVRVTKDGLKDPVLSVIKGHFPIFQWHCDTFTLPDGAVRLARNRVVANQCFRIGRASYGMQFHFEASRKVVEDWNADFPDTVERIRPGWLADYPRLAAEHGPEADAAGLAIARAWVALI